MVVLKSVQHDIITNNNAILFSTNLLNHVQCCKNFGLFDQVLQNEKTYGTPISHKIAQRDTINGKEEG